MPNSLRRTLLSLLLAYLILISLFIPTVVQRAAESKPLGGVFKSNFNSPKRVRVPTHSTARGGHREGEFLIRFRRNVSLEDQKNFTASIGVKEFKPLRGKSRLVKIILRSEQAFASVAVALQNSSLVESAEPNYLIYQDNANKAKPTGITTRPPQQPAIPNDPRFSEQWALQNPGGKARLFGSDIDVTSIWSHVTGHPDLTVAIIDTGIDFTHPDLKNQEWLNRKEIQNGKDEDNNGFVDDVKGWNFINDNSNVTDVSGHGTNVAGIIAAEGNNGIGISGVVWNANLISLRVLDANGVGDVASAIEALDYATEKGAHLINLSWGTDAKSLFLKDAIRRSSKYGAVVVCSGGNEGRDLDAVPYYPASFELPNLISVGASDGIDNPVATSNFGTLAPTVAAPGVEILTTRANLRGASGGEENYETVSGTSAAAAIVTGVVGLLKGISFSIKAEDIKRGLIASARSSLGLKGKNAAGGTVSVARGLKALNSDREESEAAGDQDIPRNSDSPTSIDTAVDALGTRSSERNKNSEKKIRRRKTAGPDLPDLDLQKNMRPPHPRLAATKPTSGRYCSPSVPDCLGQVTKRSPLESVVNGPRLVLREDRLIASQSLGVDRLFATVSREEDLNTLVPLMRRTIDKDFALDSDVRLDPSPASFFTITVDNYVTGFYQGALTRNPNTTELTFWKNQLKDAKWLGASSVLETAKYLGSALFLSGEYIALGTNNTDYVTDLYWAYYQHAPDGNLSYWVGQVASVGRESVRNSFAASSEFSTFVGTIDVGTYPTTTGNFSTARIDILNRAGTGGEDLLSGNVSFGIPILSLPGRAGLNVSLGLSYNSRVWSKANSTVAFDTDRGFPSPGFRLGFPVVQPLFYNSVTGTASFLLITPSGSHIELRRVGATNVYESADSQYTQLTDNTTSLLVRTTDGTLMTYTSSNGQWVCTQIKDRNGNYLTINYNSAGNITTIVDTLERTVTFNYDGNGRLQTITQPWTVGGSSVTHTWATFSYSNITIDTNFSGVYMLWPQDNAVISMLTEVAFANGADIDFEYNAFGQVNKVKRNASDDSLQSQTRYVYDTPTADVPRVTDRYDWARYWNGDTEGTVASGEEARTQFTTGLNGGVMTAPDNTIYKEFYASSTWQKGLTTSTEIWVSSTKEKWTTTSWTQDNTGVSYFLNPKVTETNVYDVASNRRRTTVTYTDYSLPDVVTEYEANASTVYRKIDTDYVTSSTYTNIRVIGLPSKIEIKDASNNVKSKTEFTYDSSGEYFTNVTGKDKHDDTNYGSGFITGRGNVCLVKRYEIGGSGSIETDVGYNSLGQVVFTRDGANHQTDISYADSFSDGINNRNTSAYPTTAEDADDNDYLTQYNYDHGGMTRTESPLGAVVTQTYDSVGRRDATTSLASTTDTTKQARTRFEYGTNYQLSYVRGFDGTNEAYTNTQFDGAGRVRGVASDFPGSTGGYKASYTYYDIMGQAIEQTNPTEVNSSWVPAGDDSAGFLSVTQTYDWRGRPLVTTNQDDTTKTLSYSGCGCAGGEVVTVLDEVGRKQKMYSDVFGRSVKTEVYSDSTTVNSTVVTTYNLFGQPTQLRHFSGADTSGTYQDTTFQYDGYGRLWKTHKPEYATNTFDTITYNADDTRATVTDPRGAITTFTHNNRHLMTGVSYSAPSGIPTVSSATYTYDAAGNRLSMTSTTAEVDYVYDTASRMTSETQTVNGVTGAFTLNYTYKPIGVLASVEDPYDRTVSYSYNKTGQLTSVSGASYPNVTSFISSVQYRAWGNTKSVAYGNGVDENTEFNERLLPTEYELVDLRDISNNLYTDRVTFDYYDDGRLFHSFYATGSTKFDRKFEYDFAGRVKEAYTGREAHDLAPLNPRDNPYRQSFQYDAFGNIAQRNGFLWRQAIPTDTASYTNNRRSDWSYDAAGNVVYTEAGGAAPDAAGNLTYATRSQTDDLGNGDFRLFDSILSQSIDGDGFIRRREEYRYVEQWIGEDGEFNEETTTTFNLWSTVLGAMIAELDDEGDPTTCFVYAGSRIAKLDITPSSSAVKFEFTNPQTQTLYVTDHTGKGARNKEYDPLGAEVPNFDPFIFTNKRLYSDHKSPGDLFRNGGSDPFRYDSNCQLDGMPISCSLRQQLISSGSVMVQKGVGPTAERIPIDSYGLGIYREWVPTGAPAKRVPRLKVDDPDITDVIVTDTNVQNGEYIYKFFDMGPIAQGPQQVEPTNTDKLVARARQLLAHPNRNDCKAMTELIRYAGDLFRHARGAANALGSVLAGGDVARLALRAGAGRVTGRHETSQPIVDGFGSVGFSTTYQDFHDSPNQVRHFIGGLLAGMSQGPGGLDTMNGNETDPNGTGAADVRLNSVAVPLGTELQLFNTGYIGMETDAERDRMHQLANDVEKRICDPNVR